MCRICVPTSDFVAFTLVNQASLLRAIHSEVALVVIVKVKVFGHDYDPVRLGGVCSRQQELRPYVPDENGLADIDQLVSVLDVLHSVVRDKQVVFASMDLYQKVERTLDARRAAEEDIV